MWTYEWERFCVSHASLLANYKLAQHLNITFLLRALCNTLLYVLQIAINQNQELLTHLGHC